MQNTSSLSVKKQIINMFHNTLRHPKHIGYLTVRGLLLIIFFVSWFPLLFYEGIFCILFAFLHMTPVINKIRDIWAGYFLYSFLGHVG